MQPFKTDNPCSSLSPRHRAAVYFLFTVIVGLLASLLSVAEAQRPLPRKGTGVWTLDWSYDDAYVATGGDDSTLYIYRTSDYSLHQSVKLNGMIKSARWHPRENVLAIATHMGVSLLHLPSGQLSPINALTVGGRGIGWNHTGELLALADGRGVVQIVNRQGTLLRSIPKHNNHSYLALDWHPTKNILVASSDEIHVFDTSGKQLSFIRHRKEPAGILSLRWHPSGAFFASGDYGHEDEGIPTLLQFWKEDGTLLKTMLGSKAEFRNIHWSRDGQFLATASDALRIWNREGELLSTGTTGYNLWSIGWNSTGSQVLTASFDGHFDLWTPKATHIRKID